MEHWIIGLMRENYEAVGFIPAPTVEARYIRLGRYVLQHDEKGRRVGYLLHGALVYGRSLSVAQHCVQFDYRLRGYGEAAVSSLVARGLAAGVSAVSLRCAADLPSLSFWRAQGFEIVRLVPGGARRGRLVAEMILPLSLPLLPEL